MKPSAKFVVFLGVAVSLTGCDNIFGLDNYDPPDATLTGRVVYNGEPVHVRSNGVELELWQPGFELNQKIPVRVAQDGSFTSALFDGTYKLIPVAGNGPWVNTTDTMTIDLRGEANVDFPVTPYFVVQNPQLSYAASPGPQGTVNASFSIGSVAASSSRNVEFVGLYISTTAFADRTNRVVQVERSRSNLPANWATAPVSLSVALPGDIRVTPSPEVRDHVYARIGIKTTGVTEMIFSPLVKLSI